jgi:hypothetical protein
LHRTARAGKVCPIFLASAMHPARKPLTGRAAEVYGRAGESLVPSLREFTRELVLSELLASTS